MTTAIVSKSESTKIRQEIQEIVTDLRGMRKRADKKIVRLAKLVSTVQQKQLFRQWKEPGTNKLYASFNAWIHAEIQESRASVYRFLGVRAYLKGVPDETLEKIGSTKCFELVKVAREKPAMLDRFVKDLEKNPEIPLFTLQQRVTNTIAGRHPDSGDYTRVEFAVKSEDYGYVIRALAVMQSLEAVENPETAAGRGVHLVSMAQEFLSGKQEAKVLAELEKAGAFSKAAFEVEE